MEIYKEIINSTSDNEDIYYFVSHVTYKGEKMNTLQIKGLTIGEGSPKIIVPLVSSTKEELLEEAQVVKDLKPDVVEWRVDLYENVENLESVKEMISALRTVLIEELILFTFRSHKEGGNKVITDDFYVGLNQTAIRTGQIELVDVELFNEEEIVKAILDMC